MRKVGLQIRRVRYGKENGTRYSEELKEQIIAEYAKKRTRKTYLVKTQRLILKTLIKMSKT